MGAIITRLRRGRKKERNPKNKKKKGKVVVAKRGSITHSSSRRVRGSTRSRRSHGAQRSQNRQRKPPPEPSTNTDTDDTSHIYMAIDDNVQPASLGGTQANDTQRRKQRSTRTKRSQKAKNTVERRPLNDIFPKRGEDETDTGKMSENNIQRRGSKLRTSQRSARGSLKRRRSSRKLKKHLFPSPTVFSQIDAHAIKAGEELRRKRIFSVKAITEKITEGAVTDLQKLRAIWIWLCHNIEYDVSGYFGMTEMITSIEQVIETRKGVCDGYARLCEQMCSEVGIECREVIGHSKGAGYRPGLHAEPTKSDHAWNAVRLQGNWYLLDSCWGAGTIDMTEKVFNQCYNEFYFLTDPDMFISDHFPDEVEWQLLKEPLSLEEFRMRVQKYSFFFQLGLTLHHPTHFLLVTENGEATISMTFPEPLEFTYTICQRSSNNQTELSTSAAFLTVTTTHMKLRLRPPTQGTFDINVFARTANTSGKHHCVCNFLLECPKPSPLDSFPENPSKSWGLKQSAKNMGLKSCQYQAEIMLESGTFEMVLQTSRPLMMLCELFHKDLVEEMAKRCLATQSEPDQLSCHVLCPYMGYYRLTVFVKDCDSTDSFSPVGTFLLHCTSSASININKLFPPGLSSKCGPGNATLKAGLTDFNHTRPIINTQQGQCSITFRNQHSLKLKAYLSGPEHQQPKHPLSRYVLLSCDEKDVTISVALPGAGVYRLKLFGGPANSTSSHLCDYVLWNDWDGENRSISWGLDQNAKSLGLKPGQYQGEIVLESASFEMVLQTSRPLMMLCELFHKDLDKELAKRCLATQSEPDQLSCHVLCLYVGYYELKVFVKDCDSTDSYSYVGTFLLDCTSSATININKLFPPGLSSDCGPGNATLKAGLADFNHTRAIINTQQGQCSVTFCNQHSLKLKADLSGPEHQQPKHPLSRYVLLSCDEKDVTISVALPGAGVYRLKLYGGPATSTSSHLCDYVLWNDWDGENRSISWGLDQNAKSLGLKPGQYQGEIVLDSSTFEMVLQTSRPLMMLCELFHKDLDKELAKRCLATQSEPDQLSCHVLCPYVGYYELKVFVKDCDSTDSYSYVGTFLLDCTSSATVNINRLFPPGLSSDCGPGNATLKAGLADFSHTRPIINTQQGKCSITFRNQHSLKLKANLSGQECQQPKHPLSRYVLLSCDERDVTISVALPGAGVYRLKLFGGSATSTSLSHICDYVLWNDWDGACPPFPENYST